MFTLQISARGRTQCGAAAGVCLFTSAGCAWQMLCSFCLKAQHNPDRAPPQWAASYKDIGQVHRCLCEQIPMGKSRVAGKMETTTGKGPAA